MALTSKLSAIANAIRSKTGVNKKLSLEEMAAAINNINLSSGSSGDDCFGIKYIYSSTDTFWNTYDFTTQIGRLASIPLGEYPPDIFKINVNIVPTFTTDFQKISKEIIGV
ncbi:MAG: hypothetical protein HDP34_04380 [Clostridia bacterium]|nr:hypothetical protein [Clostridia bacterium]